MESLPRAAKFRVKISIIRANNLRPADLSLIGQSKSDPYCICKLAGRPETDVRTQTVMKTLDPTWKFECEMPCMKATDTLEFQVMDYDTIGSDDLLGNLELTFDQIYPGGVDDTLELSDPARKDGKIATLRLKVIPELIETPVPDTRCFVTVYKAEGLRSADWSLFGGKSDPYCIVNIPGKKHSAWRTRVMFKELNPTWDEEEDVIGYEPGTL